MDYETFFKTARTEITRVKDTKGFGQSREAAKQAGNVVGTARKQLEGQAGRKVISAKNYLVGAWKAKLKKIGV